MAKGGKLELHTDAHAEMRARIEKLKPMRPVDVSILLAGKRCMKEYYDTLEERSKKAVKLSQTAQVTIDHLRRAHEDDVTSANIHISLLKSQLAQAEADLTQSQADVVQLQTQAAVSCPPKCVSAMTKLDDLIDDVSTFLADKHLTLLANTTTQFGSVPVIAKETWMQQKNTNPQFSTIREIKYTPPTKGSTQGKWFFDSSDKKQDPKALDNFVEITDPAICTKLQQLGYLTPTRKLFKPAFGSMVTYSYNNHTYEVSVVYSVKPWFAALQPAAKSESVACQMMLHGPFFAPSNKELEQYGANVDTNEAMHEIVGHAKLAKFATLWSSFSYGFCYDEQRSTLWVKPKWLATWLETAKFKDYEIRVVGHGVRSCSIDTLANDPRGFDLAKCYQGGRAQGDGGKGYGIYVSPLDAIPADYNNKNDGGYGTMVIGLLLVEKPDAGRTATTTSSASYQVSTGAYEFYSLDTHSPGFRPDYLAKSAYENDAYCVRDPTLFLPLGKVVAK